MELEQRRAAGMCSSNSQNEIVPKKQKKTKPKPTFPERQRRKHGWRRDPGAGKAGGGAVGEGGRCMIKARVWKSLTSPLV